VTEVHASSTVWPIVSAGVSIASGVDPAAHDPLVSRL